MGEGDSRIHLFIMSIVVMVMLMLWKISDLEIIANHSSKTQVSCNELLQKSGHDRKQ